MDYDTFKSEMNRILSSGDGIAIDEWHNDQLSKLFAKVPDENQLVGFVNQFYEETGQYYESVLDGELETIADLLGKKVTVTITFE